MFSIIQITKITIISVQKWTMEKQPMAPHPEEHPHLEKPHEITPPPDPEDPLHIPEEMPDYELEEDPYDTPPPFEMPEPGEGP